VTREGFAEAQILLDGIPEWGQHQIIPPADFFAGDWQFLRDCPNPPKQTAKLPKDGNEAIAQAVVDFFA
jgi:hypothetical protein